MAPLQNIVHHGKTRIRNRSGVCPARCEELEVAARIVDPHAKVWRGSHEADLEEQGITVLGTPVGRPEFVERDLQKVIASHAQFLQRIPEVKDLQCAWLLLLYCGVARATFYTRTVRPELTTHFAMEHDEQIWRCFSTLLGVNPEAPDAHAKASTSLPLVMGGLGLRSASRLWDAAHWGSWADTLKMVHERHPMVADDILRAMAVRSEAPAIEAINQSVENLLAVGYDVPTWESLMTNTNVPVADVEEPNQPRVGWQAAASRAVETCFMRRLLPTLSDSEAALFRSQGGLSLQRLSSARHGTERAGWSPSRSECCCFVAFASLSPSQRVPADVAVLSTSLATIGQRVLLWGGWVARDFRWKMQPPGCVGRLGEGCAPTRSFETWTLVPLTRLMHGGSKSWLMDCRCSGEPSLQLTRRWCVH